ncbi:hypothetical protein IJT93_04720 [bacterium]|nr:hypothetical protein [bacterium]
MQRYLRIGYARARRLLDLLMRRGDIRLTEESKRRRILEERKRRSSVIRRKTISGEPSWWSYSGRIRD